MFNHTSRWVATIFGLVFAFHLLAACAEEVVVIDRFEITRFDVQGNTLLPEQEIHQTLAPFIGKNQNFESVQKAMKALESDYRQKGYDVVQVLIPEQELNHGVVQLKVIETHIGKISVTGNQFFDDANIRRSVPALQEGQTPNLTEISASLKVANENPAKKTVVQLQAGEQAEVVDALLQVEDSKPWQAALGVDNTGDSQTGRNRVTATWQNANIADLDHVLNLQYTTSLSHPSAVRIFGAGYHIPLYALGDSLDVYASYSSVDSGVVAAGAFGFAVSGNGTVYGTRYNHNFLKQGSYDSSLSAGLDYKIFRNNISLFNIPLGNKVAVHPLSLTYTGALVKTNTSFNFSLSGIHNVPGGTDGGSTDFNQARFDASPNYNLLRYTTTFAHAFPKDWQTRLILNGQITTDALVQGEQFGAGGANSVRGFYEREIINDRGHTANVELYTPNLCSENTQCRVLSFYDAAWLSRNHPLPGEETQQSISSIGLGVRTNIASRWIIQTDLAHVLNGSTLTPTGTNRAHFRLIMMF